MGRQHLITTELIGFDHDDRGSRTCEVGGDGRSGTPTTDDHGVVDVFRHQTIS
jgi:hypothetical protein